MSVKLSYNKAVPYIFLLPALLVFAFALIIPTLYGLRLSFFDWKMSELLRIAPKFIGLGNFTELFGSEFFHTSIRVTLVFTFSILVAELLVGTALALLLERKMAGLRLFRTIFVLPLMIAPIVVGVVWRYLYDPSFGLINYFIGLLGFAPRLWLADPNLALTSIIITDIWQWTPFVFLLILAALQGIPQDLIEAGVVDGASYWQTLIHIKLPYIRNILAVTIVLRLIDAFKGLEVMYIMTFGGPGMSTSILSIFLFKTAFNSQRLGLASAVSVILMAIIAVSSVFLFFLTPSEGRRK